MSTSNEEARSHLPVDPTLVAQASGLARALPDADAPSPPSAFDPAAMRSLGRKLQPRHAQVELAPTVASELRRNGAAYAQQFGDAVPPAEEVADALTLAHGWSAKVRNAERWLLYARYEEQLAWQHAFSLTDVVRVAFRARRARIPTVADHYPALATFFDLLKQAAARANATKRANRDAKTDGAAP